MTPLAHAIRSAAVWAAFAACVALAAIMLLPALAGYERYVIVSGSMTGSYDQGSIVYAKPVPVTSLRVGDVITYAPPAGMSPTELVTHRIESIRSGPDGPVFRTKGDANRTPDPWSFTLSAATQPRAEFAVPFAGRVLSALADRELRMLLIGLPAALVGLLILAGLAADIRRHRRRRHPVAVAGR